MRCGELFGTPGNIDMNRANKGNNYIDDSDVILRLLKFNIYQFDAVNTNGISTFFERL